MTRIKIFIFSSLLALSACSYVPFVGDDDDDAPAKVKQEKVKTGLVFTSKGKEQCEEDTGDSTKVTKARLEASGIKVYSSQCAKITGMMHPSLCGSTTLDINIHEINEKNFPQAQKLGYESLEVLDDKDLGYRTYACDL